MNSSSLLAQHVVEPGDIDRDVRTEQTRFKCFINSPDELQPYQRVGARYFAETDLGYRCDHRL
jgi:hypothetical protein